MDGVARCLLPLIGSSPPHRHLLLPPHRHPPPLRPPHLHPHRPPRLLPPHPRHGLARALAYACLHWRQRVNHARTSTVMHEKVIVCGLHTEQALLIFLSARNELAWLIAYSSKSANCHALVSTYLCGCLPTCPHTCLPALTSPLPHRPKLHPYACLGICPPTRLPTCLYYLPAYLPRCLPALSACPCVYLPAYLPACLPACLPISHPASLPACVTCSWVVHGRFAWRRMASGVQRGMVIH